MKEMNQKRLVSLYNTLPNVLWSLLGLVPISFFCYKMVPLSLVFLLMGIALVPCFLPNRLLERGRVSNHPTRYLKLGVGLVQRLSQNGELVNRAVRRQIPSYRAVYTGKKSVQRLINQTYMLEKFHLMLFVFFALVTIYAGWQGLYGWAAVLLVTNVFYNAYPILLQQYIRLKIGGRP